MRLQLHQVPFVRKVYEQSKQIIMKLIAPKFEIVEQAPGMEGMLKHIERCGRVCYKSEDKITEDSAEKFVERMKTSQHLSVLEHGAVYLKIGRMEIFSLLDVGVNISDLFNSGYTRFSLDDSFYYVSTNLRVIEECGANRILKHQCEPTEFHEKRVTVKFTTDIGVSREFNRHRVNSVTEQSTRYCNFSKNKFGNEISVVPPKWLRDDNPGDELYAYGESVAESCMYVFAEDIVNGNEGELTEFEVWLFANLASEWAYNKLTQRFGRSAQDARSVLPLDTQTELYHTAFVSDWRHFFELRTDCHAHPMARELAIPLREEFVKRGLIKE